jgi:hypothetical protein
MMSHFCSVVDWTAEMQSSDLVGSGSECSSYCFASLSDQAKHFTQIQPDLALTMGFAGSDPSAVFAGKV